MDDVVVQLQQEEGEEGWPLGLQRVGFGRVLNHDRHGSISFTTLLTASPSSASSSDLDTKSSGSFFRERNATLGRLIGISNLLELSRRSIRARQMENPRNDKKNSCRTKSWFFSLCSKVSTDAASMNVNVNRAPSLGYFLQAERRAADIYRGNHPSREAAQANNFSTTLDALFLEDQVAPSS